MSGEERRKREGEARGEEEVEGGRVRGLSVMVWVWCPIHRTHNT